MSDKLYGVHDRTLLGRGARLSIWLGYLSLAVVVVGGWITGQGASGILSLLLQLAAVTLGLAVMNAHLSRDLLPPRLDRLKIGFNAAVFVMSILLVFLWR